MAKYERCQQSREMDLREQLAETAQADRRYEKPEEPKEEVEEEGEG